MSGSDRTHALRELLKRRIVIIDGAIDSPGIRAHPQYTRFGLIDPVRIAEAFYYLHTQDPSCWSHEIQLTPAARVPTF